jgi:chemotaxis protein MotB
MGRRHQHEDHVNHEAWAIPYGDLVTLLLAFFVVMYAVSSVNEGKYRVMADALASAFGGRPRTMTPIQLGQQQLRGSAYDRPSLATPAARTAGPTSAMPVQIQAVRQMMDIPTFGQRYRKPPPPGGAYGPGHASQQLQSIGQRVEKALSELVKRKLVVISRRYSYLEVEIRSDVLFDSGVAAPNGLAQSTISTVGAILRDEPNPIRVEGYTDDRPIHTLQFDSNWELSAARAASVVHVMIDAGVSPSRLAVVGYGDQQPIADNATLAGRNANRRVQLVILAAPQPIGEPSSDGLLASAPESAPAQADSVQHAPVRMHTTPPGRTLVAASQRSDPSAGTL